MTSHTIFLEHYLPKIGDRTVDQMKQAARSGKQNIAEGNETGTTSMEACITLANVALVLIHQTDFLLKRLLDRFKTDFLEHGGIKEQMSQARRNWREEHGMGYMNGNYGKDGRNGRNEKSGNPGNYGNYGNNGQAGGSAQPADNDSTK